MAGPQPDGLDDIGDVAQELNLLGLPQGAAALILDHCTAEDFRWLGREHRLVEPELDSIAVAASKFNFR